MDNKDIISAIEAILFAAGEPVPASRIALVLEVDVNSVLRAAMQMAERLERERSGIRLLRLEDKLQLCSAPEYSQMIVRALEQRKPPKLTQAALEVLSVVAYFQPVTRAYIDQSRGMGSSYTVSVLSERGLIEACGKLEAPGRPTLYGTGDVFLRTMGISDLSELPLLPDMTTDEGVISLQNTIDALSSTELEGQMSFDDTE